METKTENLLVQKEGKIAKIVVNRPGQRNAFKKAMWFDLMHIMDRLGSDPEVMIVIITGAGDKAFVAGADISEMTGEYLPVAGGKIVNPVAEATRTVEGVEKVVIAMINGYAIGGGCELAMACDLKVAADSAQIGITSAKLGICIPSESIKRLVDLVGPSKAKDILFTGRLLSAQEALSIGLLDYVVPKEELELFTLDLAKRIVENAPLSVLGAKKTVDIVSRNYNVEKMEDKLFFSNQCYGSEDFKEGVRAFNEKKRPRFKGK